MTVLESLQNRWVKEARSLSRKKEREATGRYLIEGVRLLEEAVNSKLPLSYCLYSEKITGNARGQKLLDHMAALGIECLEVTEKALDSVTETEQSQGIVAVSSLPMTSWESLLSIPQPFLLIVDGLQDPGNLGTIIRTAEAAGVKGVLLSPGTVDPFNPKVIRSAMGSLFRLPVAFAPSIGDLVEGIKDRGISLTVGDAKGDLSYYEVDWTDEALAIVIGSEAHGPNGAFLAQAKQIVRIPLTAPVESLNAAVAAALLIFEAAKYRLVASKKGV